jgi:hypothetical protein
VNRRVCLFLSLPRVVIPYSRRKTFTILEIIAIPKVGNLKGKVLKSRGLEGRVVTPIFLKKANNNTRRPKNSKLKSKTRDGHKCIVVYPYLSSVVFFVASRSWWTRVYRSDKRRERESHHPINNVKRIKTYCLLPPAPRMVWTSDTSL